MYTISSLIGLALLIAYAAVYYVRRYSALSHVPGPTLAAWTDFWLFSKYRNKTDPQQLYRDLHQQYGPTFRYGPNRVMFSDPAAVPVIYSTTHVFEKVSRSSEIDRSSHLPGPILRCTCSQSQREVDSIHGHYER
jgi:hypothetical protein